MHDIVDAGAMKHGNFINYYQFHAAEERKKVLPVDIWMPGTEAKENDNTFKKPYLLLDVGCNTGQLTEQCWKHITTHSNERPVHALGIDLDEILIARAVESNTEPEHITYACVDVMDEIAFEATTGKFLRNFERTKFDAVCCFSITMWIHLNYHDAGLQKFLRRLSNLTDLLVIEPQPWKCYQNAQRRMRRIGEEFPLFLELKWRTELDKKITDFVQFELQRKKIHETEKTPWQRSIFFYR